MLELYVTTVVQKFEEITYRITVLEFTKLHAEHWEAMNIHQNHATKTLMSTSKIQSKYTQCQSKIMMVFLNRNGVRSMMIQMTKSFCQLTTKIIYHQNKSKKKMKFRIHHLLLSMIQICLMQKFLTHYLKKIKKYLVLLNWSMIKNKVRIQTKKTIRKTKYFRRMSKVK